ncbi:prepilin-type N-terminal cleavage/methylation domain-containing protein [Cyanobium sp. N5-Cardenillas]|uniref:prepilin-type N-terminal cleavage/methylation domain-containing protein n=1 Tax=Cyanobium sp. N5-Cardenillas TaxID=2823720 RepID=UPI0020CF7BA7|nr:prepilin-type N-terminal cleavage/methylation domain-containing protein [Cyanobium sp. N5-Cardenillas]MCP9786736.1 prepilin-type N-terminal cleavage/methylation domain-containing protein [Cyanobium sp. N5-Cardenillas]
MTHLHRPHAASPGFTLVELLVGVVVGGIALASIASVAVSHIRTTSRVTWNTQVQRDIAKMNSFLAVESREACAFSAGAAAPTDWVNGATMPTPSPCTTACTTGAANEVRLLVPFNTGPNAAPISRVIRFYTAVNGTTGLTELRRDGPGIAANGQLNATNLTGSVLVDGVNTFTANVSPDCRTVTLQLSFDVPNNGGTTPLESITLTTGVRMFS